MIEFSTPAADRARPCVTMASSGHAGGGSSLVEVHAMDTSPTSFPFRSQPAAVDAHTPPSHAGTTLVRRPGPARPGAQGATRPSSLVFWSARRARPRSPMITCCGWRGRLGSHWQSATLTTRWHSCFPPPLFRGWQRAAP
jgi:hypothetical protein